jgi:hypothetical protein
MQAVWENRFNVLGGPLLGLLSIMIETGKALRTATEPVIECLGVDVLTREYPEGEATELKGKK